MKQNIEFMLSLIIDEINHMDDNSTLNLDNFNQWYLQCSNIIYNYTILFLVGCERASCQTSAIITRLFQGHITVGGIPYKTIFKLIIFSCLKNNKNRINNWLWNYIHGH